jgi:gliding motility-associated-like protein
LSPWTRSVDKTDPTCTQPHGGTIRINVTGTQSPYYIRYRNTKYANGASIDGLSRGGYNFSILNSDNCEIDTVNVSLNLKQDPECDFVFVPSAFTPNNDGLNDLLIPYLGAGITSFQFSVYNRWGQLVYVTTTRETGWDGKISGRSQPSGVYAWSLTYKTESNPAQKLVKGTFTLIR